MKILHILNRIEFSGAEIMLNNAAPFFISKSIETHILSTGCDVGPYSSELIESGYKVHHISFKKSPQYLWRLLLFFKKEKFDVIHIHPERGFMMHALTAKLAGVGKIFRTYHSVFLFSGFLRKRKKFERWLLVHLLGVKNISIGSSVRQVERNLFNNQTTLIPNWADNQKFYPASEVERKKLRSKYGLCDSDIVLISVGSCSLVKNHAVIINSLEKVIEKVPKIVYLHIGEGDLLDAEKELANRKGVSKFIRFLGNTNQVREFLVISDIFIMPSSHEGFGISALEASFCGLPIIAFNVYGLRDIVNNNVNGLLIEPNVEKLVDAIVKLSKDDELRYKMGIEARALAIANFDMKSSISLLIESYNN